MTLTALIVIVLLIANVIWGIQTNFRGGWPLWTNFIGSVLLALIVFTSLL